MVSKTQSITKHSASEASPFSEEMILLEPRRSLLSISSSWHKVAHHRVQNMDMCSENRHGTRWVTPFRASPLQTANGL